MRTGIYDKHCVLGAKIVEFAGWDMPVYYRGIIHEHRVVRQKVGIFDVSHMGRIHVKGPDTERFLDYLSTNTIAKKKDFTATYTVWCLESGGSLDDLIVYRISQTEFFVVVNASNRKKDLEHLHRLSNRYEVIIKERYQDGIIAIQGPQAKSLVGQVFDVVDELKPMCFLPVAYHGEEIFLSGTGYTGAGGVEIYASMPAIVDLWDRMLAVGEKYGIEPIGLGARDTLRLEMGYALYGHELNEDIAPTESVSAWTVKWNKENFLGMSALKELQHSPKKRAEYGIVLQGKGIAREGYKVYKEGRQIGKVTSGTMSPSLHKAIAIILVEGKLQEGDNLEVQIRHRSCPAKVVQLPFYSFKPNA